MAGKSHGKSRRKTPWDKTAELTATQEFLRAHYLEHYASRHPKLSDHVATYQSSLYVL